MTRVEYPISANYAKNWTVAQALSELIANMLDEASKNGGSYLCSHDRGLATFRDYGEGFDPSCLMLGEGEEKGEMQIGQFKEGMKLALLVLARSNKKVSVRSSRCCIDKVGFEDTVLGKPGMVVYVADTDADIQGTEVKVRCSKRDFRKACGQYITLSVEGEPAPVIPESNAIIVPEKNGKGTISINGRRVGRSHYAFSYSLRGSDVKGAMNRDRNVLDLDSALQKVRALWTACGDLGLVYALLSYAYAGGKVPEMSGYIIHPWSTGIWKDAFQQLFGTEKLFYYQGRDDVKKRELERLGYKAIIRPESRSSGASLVDRIAANLFDDESRTLSRHIRVHSTGDSGVMRTVALQHIDQDHIETLNWAVSLALDILDSSGLDTYVRLDGVCKSANSVDWAVFTENTADPDCAGAWYAGRLWVKSSMLAKRRELLEVCMHEVVHAVTGLEDNTREFEKALGRMMSAAALSSTRPAIMYDVTQPAGSKARVRSNVQLDPRKLSLDEIIDIFSRIGGVSIDPRAAKKRDKLAQFEWQYGGSTGHNCWCRPIDQARPNGEVHHFFLTPAKRRGLYSVEAVGQTDERMHAPGGWRLSWSTRNPGYCMGAACRRASEGIDGSACSAEHLIPGFIKEGLDG